MNEAKREAISIKIKALMTRTTENGCTEAEAISASKKVQELMNDYDISMSEVEVANEEFIKGDMVSEGSNRSNVHFLINKIGYFTDTKVYLSRKMGYNHRTGRRKTNSIVYTFFGTRKDVEVAKFLYSMLGASIEFNLKQYKKTDTYKNNHRDSGQTKSTSFRMGMVNRLSVRLTEIKDAQKIANTEAGVMLYDKSAIVAIKFKELLNLKLGKERSAQSRNIDGASYKSGQSAGDKVNFNSGVKGGVKGQQMLG